MTIATAADDTMIITLVLRLPIPLLPPPHIMATTTTITVHPKPTADLVHDPLLIAILLMKAMVATASIMGLLNVNPRKSSEMSLMHCV